MNWLVTTRKGVSRATLEEDLSSIGCVACVQAEPVPLSDGEQVFEVEGPANLQDKVTAARDIIAAYPNSRPVSLCRRAQSLTCRSPSSAGR